MRGVAHTSEKGSVLLFSQRLSLKLVPRQTNSTQQGAVLKYPQNEQKETSKKKLESKHFSNNLKKKMKGAKCLKGLQKGRENIPLYNKRVTGDCNLLAVGNEEN